MSGSTVMLGFRRLASRTLAKMDSFLFWPQAYDYDSDEDDDEHGVGQRTRVAELFRDLRFQMRDLRGAEHSYLVGEPGKEASQGAGRELIDMSRNHTPSSL